MRRRAAAGHINPRWESREVSAGALGNDIVSVMTRVISSVLFGPGGLTGLAFISSFTELMISKLLPCAGSVLGKGTQQGGEETSAFA